MNDSIIITALECCDKANCDSCPLSFDNCYKNLARFVLGIINRQEEEKARLREENKVYKTANINISGQRDIKEEEIECLRSQLQTSKSEAVREFAERYKKEITEQYEDIAYKDLFFGVIDRLLEEMGVQRCLNTKI